MQKQRRRKLNKENKFFLRILPPYTSAYSFPVKKWIQSKFIKHPERHRKVIMVYGIRLKPEIGFMRSKVNIVKRSDFEFPVKMRDIWDMDFIDPL